MCSLEVATVYNSVSHVAWFRKAYSRVASWCSPPNGPYWTSTTAKSGKVAVPFVAHSFSGRKTCILGTCHGKKNAANIRKLSFLLKLRWVKNWIDHSLVGWWSTIVKLDQPLFHGWFKLLPRRCTSDHWPSLHLGSVVVPRESPKKRPGRSP